MRPPLGWLIPVAVVAVGVFAALDALRFSDEQQPPAEASATETTPTPRETEAQVESSSELLDQRVVKLIPGRVTSDFLSEMDVAFTVPPGWYGYQGEGVIVLGNRLSPGAIGVHFASGGIVVEARPPTAAGSFAQAARSLETAPGVRVHGVSPVRIGGHPGRRYSLVLRRPVTLQGVFSFAAGLEPGEPDIILLRVGHRTVVIRQGFDQDLEAPPGIERVIQSFRFRP